VGGRSKSNDAALMLALMGIINYSLCWDKQETTHQLEGDELIVGHAGVNRVILCHALGIPLANLFQICQDYGCMNILEFDGGSLRLKAMKMPPRGQVRKFKLAHD
jgi:broad specificity phosphatase PhoE